MGYVLKEDKAEEIKHKHKSKNIAASLERTPTYVSLLINRKISCPKTTALAFVQIIDSNLQISDLFDEKDPK